MDGVTTESRRLSSRATERLAGTNTVISLNATPPPPSKGTPFITECPPLLPKKDVKPKNLLQVPVPLLQKVGGRSVSTDMRTDNASATHIPIHYMREEREPPEVPPRTAGAGTRGPGVARPVPSLERDQTRTRIANEYVDSPRLGCKKKSETAPEPVTKQPDTDKEESIFCRNCGKCKCEQCTDPKMPKAHCANKCVEYTSCMCLVKGCFYHCNSDKESEESDIPCACCSQPHCCQRWTTMAVLSLFLPCLCLYWPLKGCVKLSQTCYRRCMVRGCRCQRDKSTTTQSGHLLLESDSSTT